MAESLPQPSTDDVPQRRLPSLRLPMGLPPKGPSHNKKKEEEKLTLPTPEISPAASMESTGNRSLPTDRNIAADPVIQISRTFDDKPDQKMGQNMMASSPSRVLKTYHFQPPQSDPDAPTPKTENRGISMAPSVDDSTAGQSLPAAPQLSPEVSSIVKAQTFDHPTTTSSQTSPKPRSSSLSKKTIAPLRFLRKSLSFRGHPDAAAAAAELFQEPPEATPALASLPPTVLEETNVVYNAGTSGFEISLGGGDPSISEDDVVPEPPTLHSQKDALGERFQLIDSVPSRISAATSYSDMSYGGLDSVRSRLTDTSGAHVQLTYKVSIAVDSPERASSPEPLDLAHNPKTLSLQTLPLQASQVETVSKPIIWIQLTPLNSWSETNEESSSSHASPEAAAAATGEEGEEVSLEETALVWEKMSLPDQQPLVPQAKVVSQKEASSPRSVLHPIECASSVAAVPEGSSSVSKETPEITTTTTTLAEQDDTPTTTTTLSEKDVVPTATTTVASEAPEKAKFSDDLSQLLQVELTKLQKDTSEVMVSVGPVLTAQVAKLGDLSKAEAARLEEFSRLLQAEVAKLTKGTADVIVRVGPALTADYSKIETATSDVGLALSSEYSKIETATSEVMVSSGRALSAGCSKIGTATSEAGQAISVGCSKIGKATSEVVVTSGHALATGCSKIGTATSEAMVTSGHALAAGCSQIGTSTSEAMTSSGRVLSAEYAKIETATADVMAKAGPALTAEYSKLERVIEGVKNNAQNGLVSKQIENLSVQYEGTDDDDGDDDDAFVHLTSDGESTVAGSAYRSLRSVYSHGSVPVSEKILTVDRSDLVGSAKYLAAEIAAALTEVFGNDVAGTSSMRVRLADRKLTNTIDHDESGSLCGSRFVWDLASEMFPSLLGSKSQTRAIAGQTIPEDAQLDMVGRLRQSFSSSSGSKILRIGRQQSQRTEHSESHAPSVQGEEEKHSHPWEFQEMDPIEKLRINFSEDESDAASRKMWAERYGPSFAASSNEDDYVEFAVAPIAHDETSFAASSGPNEEEKDIEYAELRQPSKIEMLRRLPSFDTVPCVPSEVVNQKAPLLARFASWA